jgi:hypothetical protein
MRLPEARGERVALLHELFRRDAVEAIQLLVEIGDGGEPRHPPPMVSDRTLETAGGGLAPSPGVRRSGVPDYADLTSDFGGVITFKVGAALPFTR